MATLYKHGTVEADYTRYVYQRNFDYALGYIFRLMSDNVILVRSARPKGKWRLTHLKGIENFRALTKKSDSELRTLLDNIFN